jgi:hypothetical protein
MKSNIPRSGRKANMHPHPLRGTATDHDGTVSRWCPRCQKVITIDGPAWARDGNDEPGDPEESRRRRATILTGRRVHGKE